MNKDFRYLSSTLICSGILAAILFVATGCSKDSTVVAPTVTTYTLAMLYDKTDRADTTTSYSITYSPTATIAWGTDSLQLENHVPQTISFPRGTALTSRYSAHIVNPSAASPDTIIQYLSTLTLNSNAVWRF